MASHGTAIALPRRPVPRPVVDGPTGRHRRASAAADGRSAAATSPSSAPVDLDAMLVWFVVLLALGLLGVVASALA